MQLNHIDIQEEKLPIVIQRINRAFDEIAESVEALKKVPTATVAEKVEVEEAIQSVQKRISVKNVKFGVTDSSTVKNTTLFVDKNLGNLRFKNDVGTIWNITP